MDGIVGFSAGDNMTINQPYTIGQVTFVQDANTTDASANVIYVCVPSLFSALPRRHYASTTS
jgi:hypothetical protein